MHIGTLLSYVDATWNDSIIPTLCDYIQIPNKSPLFDGDWEKHGHMDRAAELLQRWVQAHSLPRMTSEILRLPGRTPVLFIDVAATTPEDDNGCVLMYGHLDKQPEFDGWATGLGPWVPVIRDGRLYGRGAADDGYALFASVTALLALSQQGVSHSRCVILIEGSEESSSRDLPAYMSSLADRIGEPSLVIALDAECGNYEQLWCTNSLRGHVTGRLRVQVLNEGVHSGLTSGIVASSMRIARALLDRVEDSTEGYIRLPALHADIPPERLAQVRTAAAVLGPGVYGKLPLVQGMSPVSHDPVELLLNSTWRPTLCVTGADGLPSVNNAGNVLRPHTTFKLSFRFPPTVDPAVAAEALKSTLESDPPYGAQVEFSIDSCSGGWNAPSIAPWLDEAISTASHACFGREPVVIGIGGTIPFIRMLGERFPHTQFLVSGVLGPQSNAHGPNEFLHIETAKRITACVALIVAAHSTKPCS